MGNCSRDYHGDTRSLDCSSYKPSPHFIFEVLLHLILRYLGTIPVYPLSGDLGLPFGFQCLIHRILIIGVIQGLPHAKRPSRTTTISGLGFRDVTLYNRQSNGKGHGKLHIIGVAFVIGAMVLDLLVERTQGSAGIW